MEPTAYRKPSFAACSGEEPGRAPSDFGQSFALTVSKSCLNPVGLPQRSSNGQPSMTHASDVIRLHEGPSQLGFFRQAGEAVAGGDAYFREVLEALPAAVYITDADGHITFYNEAAAALWGHRPELGKSEWCGSWKLFWPDGSVLPHGECPMALALKQRRPIRGMEAVAERPDGSRVPFIPFPTPLYDAAGTLTGAVNMLVDITDRKRVEQHEQRLASIVESSDDAIISVDLNGRITTWNSAAERLYGYAPHEIIGKSVTLLFPPDRPHEESAILERIRRGERIDHYETARRRKDGSLVAISLTASPIKDADGRIVGASKIARDITDRIRAEEQQKLLVGEIKHRIKNTLATVQAIAMQTLRSASRDERESYYARLQALAGAHDLLTLENWNRAPLRDVVDRALEAFRERHRERFLIDGPGDIWLEANKSCLLTMALHELATNAVKYGALSNGSGQVSVAWQLLGDREPSRVKLCWHESGGPPVKPPEHNGFGTMLLERALEGGQGAAHLDFDPKGLICILELAL
jgi:two-component system CheB/CheR fusion protein